jgi:hypothetical protein
MRSNVYKRFYDSLSMYCTYICKGNVFFISGHFGCVYRGYLDIPNIKGSTLVAVKTLHRKFILILMSIMTLTWPCHQWKKCIIFFQLLF